MAWCGLQAESYRVRFIIQLNRIYFCFAGWFFTADDLVSCNHALYLFLDSIFSISVLHSAYRGSRSLWEHRYYFSLKFSIFVSVLWVRYNVFIFFFQFYIRILHWAFYRMKKIMRTYQLSERNVSPLHPMTNIGKNIFAGIQEHTMDCVQNTKL